MSCVELTVVYATEAVRSTAAYEYTVTSDMENLISNSRTVPVFAELRQFLILMVDFRFGDQHPCDPRYPGRPLRPRHGQEL